MKKRILALLLTAVLAVGVAIPALADSFPDVNRSHWGYNDIEKAASLGLVYGIEDGLYDPEGNVSYAQLCAMLTRLFFEDDYSPVGADPWYKNYIALCRSKGVLKGTALLRGGSPDDDVPRTDLARMIENAVSAAGVRTVTAQEKAAAAGQIGDIGKYSAADAACIEAAYALGVMYGQDEKGSFNGHLFMTRAEAAAVLVRMDALKKDKSVSTSTDLDAESVYRRLIAMKAQYPEGMRWTNAQSYVWHALPRTTYTGYGCAGFAFLMSDAAFGVGGDLPARKVTSVRFEDVRPGDILRINGDTHSVIILKVLEDSVIIAEGNYNSSIHWGRELTRSQVEAANYMYTRYPTD